MRIPGLSTETHVVLTAEVDAIFRNQTDWLRLGQEVTRGTSHMLSYLVGIPGLTTICTQAFHLDQITMMSF